MLGFELASTHGQRVSSRGPHNENRVCSMLYDAYKREF